MILRPSNKNVKSEILSFLLFAQVRPGFLLFREMNKLTFQRGKRAFNSPVQTLTSSTVLKVNKAKFQSFEQGLKIFFYNK